MTFNTLEHVPLHGTIDAYLCDAHRSAFDYFDYVGGVLGWILASAVVVASRSAGAGL